MNFLVLLLTAFLIVLASGPNVAQAQVSEKQFKLMQKQLNQQQIMIQKLVGKREKSIPMQTSSNEAAIDEQSALHFLKDIKISGMLDTYYSYNSNRPANRTPAGGGGETSRLRSFDLEDNSITVDNFELVLSKPSTEESRAGFTMITNYGEIAQRIVFYKNQNSGRVDDDDFTLSTAYVSYLADLGSGLDIKVGRFPTWIGYEVWESVDNPNWSRSLLYQNLDPFTHTGASAGYNVTDKVKFTGYLVNGWDSFEENNNEKTYGFQMAYTEEKYSLYVNGIQGNEKDDLNTAGDGHHDTRNLLDIVLDLNPTDKLHANINYNVGSEQNKGHWMGIAGIVDYDFTDAFNLALRGEYVNDAAIADAAGSFASNTRTGVDQNRVEIYEVTLTANFRLSEHILVRPEYRRDWSKARIFDSNSKYGQQTFACSVAYLF